jgi:hypothetical protein
MRVLFPMLLALPALADVAFFEQKIRPVLVEHCYSCHSAGAQKLKGNLYLDSKAGWQRGGDSGQPAITPGEPEASLLIRSIQHLETDLEMPPQKPKLPPEVIANFVTWVKAGASDPREDTKLEAKRADKSWWSLQPLALSQGGHSIDSFIDAKLREKGLRMSPPADPRGFIRRATYDLTGLPPSAEEVESFVRAWSQADDAQQTKLTADLVDRLLASPRYGEHWGRHWLDVIRFGESNGFERNFIIDDLWPLRDYVIRSINEDKPFDRFIMEHLAGDVIAPDDPAVSIGSAFLVAGPYDDVGNQDIVAQKNIRAATLDDMVTATSAAFLGLTINCARCHDHKFDPIPTEDYYRLRAAFEGVTHGRRVVATAEAKQAHAAALAPMNQQLAKLSKQQRQLEANLDARAKATVIPHTRPMVEHRGTEERFPAVMVKQLRFVIHSFGLESGGRTRVFGGGKLTEFQVWNAAGENVALASNGTTVEGAKAQTAEDFPEAYGPQYCIDGQLGEAWFIGSPAQLTLTFAKPEAISGITFINVRGDKDTDDSRVRGATPTEYEVQVSSDGKTWQKVASNEGREPWSSEHALAQAKAKVTPKEEAAQLAKLRADIARLRAKIEKLPGLTPIWAGIFAQPQEQTFVHRGGDPMKPGDTVLPASLSVVNGSSYSLPGDAPEGQRRLALAKWIVSAENPLTPRVLANRIWHYHFGIGLVDTPSDFGFLGSQPTHPELLDYLAQRLQQHGWRMKALHREIMISKAYRQGSAAAAGAKVDAASRLLWRFPPRRLSAEEIRDTLLAVTGKLQLSPSGGPGFRLYKYMSNNVSTYAPLDHHGPETYRRAVYHQNARASVVDVLSDYDLPDTAFSSPKRANTTTPLQALTLLNHSFTLDMAEALAAALDGPEVVEAAYRKLFHREPTAAESRAAYDLIAKHGLRALCRALLNSNELIFLE